jgi:hypothetical protein
MPSRTPPNPLVPSQATCGGVVYLSSLQDTYADPTLLAYHRIISRAWEDFSLTGVLCVDSIPTIYFRETPKPLDDEALNELHRGFWNQGVAQTLVVGDPKTVRIFSGLARPQKNDAPLTASTALVETLQRLEFSAKIDSFCQANANGAWYSEHPSYYLADNSVDAYLLENLVTLRDLLTGGEHRLSAPIAHALIGRVLFVCYLVDREIHKFPAAAHADNLNLALKNRSDTEAIDFLYALFAQLKEEFNGSMFDQDLPSEKKLIRPCHIRTIRDFLDGQKPLSPQHNLGFWAYNFKLIPVETISAIYEEFLAHEDPERKRKSGAFYTPRFLAEMTIDVAMEGRDDWHTRRYLDPCCGSGIFLVTLFNRLAARWLLDNPAGETDSDGYLRKARGLIGILANNLRGVDENLTACRLACFSLYIALLDSLAPTDIQKFVRLTGHKLPRLLADDESEPGPAYLPVVREADFLKDNGLAENTFDCIIGNPPWQGRGSKQLALHILAQAERYLTANGEGCLLLPSKIFLNSSTNKFQAQWLARVTVERVVQLADYRRILFEQAKCPGMIVRYSNKKPTDSAHRIAYDTPKFNPASRRRGLVTIGSPDHKWLAQTQLREAALHDEAPVLWKRWLWGTGRDQRLLEYLGTFPSLSFIAGGPQEGKRWIKGQGFQPDTSGKSANPKDPWWEADDLFIPARAKALEVSQLLLESDCEQIISQFVKLRRLPNHKIFKAPLVLISQGFGKVVFSSFPVLFQHSLQSIAGPREDEDLLLFLTVYLRSRLAKYCMFHTAANWGTERDKVHLEELLRLPFPLPEAAPGENAHAIVTRIAVRMREERTVQENLLAECLGRFRKLTGHDEQGALKEWRRVRKSRTAALQAEFEPLIYNYFGLLAPEQMLVADTVAVFIPSSTPPHADRLDLPTLQPVTAAKVPGYEPGLAVYAETLAETLNTWAVERGSDCRVSPLIGTNALAGMAMVSLALGNKVAPLKQADLQGELAHWLRRGFDACAGNGATLRSERELLWFEENHLHIIRPWTLIHWTRTAALNDADTIYGEIAQARGMTNG